MENWPPSDIAVHVQYASFIQRSNYPSVSQNGTRIIQAAVVNRNKLRHAVLQISADKRLSPRTPSGQGRDGVVMSPHLRLRSPISLTAS